ncbi:phage major capsid protein [Rhodobacteraceae bacterium F11138]|nr:phage major capsid protein [Rhodobacteraceae bacterium F11138]
MNSLQRRTVSAETITAGALIPWLVRGKALASRHGSVSEAVVALGAPPEIVARVKDAVGAEQISSQPGLAGSSTAVTAFISQAAETSILLRALADRAITLAPSDSWLVSGAVGALATEVSEGQPIPLTNLLTNRTRLEGIKIATMITTTRELWEDTSSEGQAFISSLIRASIAEASDRALFARLTDSGTVDVEAGADGDGIRYACETMLAAVHTRAVSRLFWALSPTAWNWLATGAGIADEIRPVGGTILGKPVIVTDGLDGRRMALVNGRAIAGNIERLDIRASGQASIQMQDAPTNDGTTPTATSTVSMFQTNGLAIRAVLHLAMQPIQDNAAAFATIADPYPEAS